MAFIILLLVIMVVGILISALNMVDALRKENSRLVENMLEIQQSIHNHGIWIAKLAKMEPMDALAEIRRIDDYNQHVEGDK